MQNFGQFVQKLHFRRPLQIEGGIYFDPNQAI